MGWLTSLFGGVSKGGLPARLQVIEQQAAVFALLGGHVGKASEPLLWELVVGESNHLIGLCDVGNDPLRECRIKLGSIIRR